MGQKAQVPWAILESSMTGTSFVLSEAVSGGPFFFFFFNLYHSWVCYFSSFLIISFPLSLMMPISGSCYQASYRHHLALKEVISASCPGREFRCSASLFTGVCVLSLSSLEKLISVSNGFRPEEWPPCWSGAIWYVCEDTKGEHGVTVSFVGLEGARRAWETQVPKHSALTLLGKDGMLRTGCSTDLCRENLFF